MIVKRRSESLNTVGSSLVQKALAGTTLIFVSMFPRNTPLRLPRLCSNLDHQKEFLRNIPTSASVILAGVSGLDMNTMNQREERILWHLINISVVKKSIIM